MSSPKLSFSFPFLVRLLGKLCISLPEVNQADILKSFTQLRGSCARCVFPCIFSVWDTKPFKKTSNIKLNATDHSGWTAIHYLVEPLEYGTYDNVHILKVLAENGANIEAKLPNGSTPLTMALDGAPKLAAGLQRLLKTKVPVSKLLPLLYNEIMLLREHLCVWQVGSDNRSLFNTSSTYM